MGLNLPEVISQPGIKQDEKLIETNGKAEQNGSVEKKSSRSSNNKPVGAGI
jgi:hypothetical protein